SEQVRIEYEPQPADSNAKATIVSVTINGQALEPEREYVVAMTDYLSGGGDYMPTLRNHKLVKYSENNFYKDVLDLIESMSGPMISSPTPRMNPLNE
ncbi:MAG: 5'-nucleotidase C-terminal domain-containing protein, partial [Muribaculaceae bacterium]